MVKKYIKAEELVNNHHLDDLCLVDVRTPAEVRSDALNTIIAMPLDQCDVAVLKTRVEKDYPDSKQIYLICQTGNRAAMAADKLADQLQQDVVIVEGGMTGIREAQGNETPAASLMSIERQVRLAAGSLVVAGVLAGYLLHPAGFALSGFVGAGLIYAAITDTCAMGMLMAKAPWNR